MCVGERSRCLVGKGVARRLNNVEEVRARDERRAIPHALRVAIARVRLTFFSVRTQGQFAPCMNPAGVYPGLSLGSPRNGGIGEHPPLPPQGPPSTMPDPITYLNEPYQGHIPMQPYIPHPQ